MTSEDQVTFLKTKKRKMKKKDLRSAAEPVLCGHGDAVNGGGVTSEDQVTFFHDFPQPLCAVTPTSEKRKKEKVRTKWLDSTISHSIVRTRRLRDPL